MRKTYEELKPEIIELIEDVKALKLKKHIPNLLTISRLLSPLVVIPLIIMNKQKALLYVMFLFALTDLLDGQIAKRLNLQSELGKLLDTTSDKIFIIIALIPLVSLSKYFIINILLEVLIGLYTLYSNTKGIKQYSTINGKIKTFVLFSTVVISYLTYLREIDKSIINTLILFTIILQVLTLISYIIQKFEIKGGQNEDI